MANLPLFAMRNHIRPAVGIPHVSLSQRRLVLLFNKTNALVKTGMRMYPTD